MRNYIKVDLEWLLDIKDEDAIIYGIIKASKDTFGIEGYDGKFYKRIQNSFINYWVPNLTKYKIKKSIERLRDSHYIKVHYFKYPSSQKRYVTPLKNRYVEPILIFNDWLSKYKYSVCFGLGYLIRKLIKEKSVDLYFDELSDVYPKIISDFKKAHLIDDAGEWTDELVKMLNEGIQIVLKNNPKDDEEDIDDEEKRNLLNILTSSYQIGQRRRIVM